jgi:hypothetical protein
MGRLLLEYGPYAWYPNHTGGIPAYAWHFSPLYILNILSALLPSWLVYFSLVIFLMTIAGYGMYRLLLGYFNLPQWLSLFGGIFFCIASTRQELQG